MTELCGYAADSGWDGRWAPLHDRLLHASVPVARAALHRLPRASQKQWLWSTLIEPHLAWHGRPFSARTHFGAEMRGTTTDILEQYVYYFGTWEPHLTAWLERRLRSGDVFVDVGSNVGYFTLLGSRLVGPSGRVVAVEASPAIFARLQRNLDLNGSGNVRAVNVAALDETRPVSIFQGSAYHSGVTSTVEDDALELETEVQGKPLSDILEPDEQQRARVIKIDVEGAEWAVVAGLAPLLRDARPDLEVTVEISPRRLELQGRTVEDVVGVFTEHGFLPYRIENDYSALSYLTRPQLTPPVRIKEPIVEETDVIFSRVDRGELP